MTHFSPYSSGQVCGVFYEFENVGDGIPLHQHDADAAHNIVVLRGRVHLYGRGVDQVLETGSVTDFDNALPHEIAALEAGSKILNLYKYGKPAGSDGLPPECFTGNMRKALVGYAAATKCD